MEMEVITKRVRLQVSESNQNRRSAQTSFFLKVVSTMMQLLSVPVSWVFLCLSHVTHMACLLSTVTMKAFAD